MSINKRKKRIIEELKNKKDREAFVEEIINIGIPFQIKALREQRELTQKDFENISGMKQALISRLENPNYSRFTLSTLKKIAATYDIGLIVRFVPISELVEWELNLSSESLEAVGFNEDVYFQKEVKKYVPPTETNELENKVCLEKAFPEVKVEFINPAVGIDDWKRQLCEPATYQT